MRATVSVRHVDAFWDRPLVELLGQLHATPAGLTSEEAARRRLVHGPNSLVRGVPVRRPDRLPPLLRQSPRHHPARGQRHLARPGRPGRRPDHHRDGPAQRAAELLHGVPGAAGHGGHPQAGGHDGGRRARRARAGAADRGAGARGRRPAQRRRPRAGGRSSAGRQGPARPRVRAHRRVAARREDGERPAARDSTASPTRATASSWARPSRPGSAPRSSSAPARTRRSARSPSGWPCGRRRPSSTAAYATSG